MILGQVVQGFLKEQQHVVLNNSLLINLIPQK
jgi:hypothetical protein